MKKALGFLGFVAFMVAFYTLPAGYIPLAIFVAIVIGALLPSNKKRALAYQRILPTSKIRSLAMGLVELEGRIELIEPLVAPIGKKTCAGYRYTIERIGRDKNGKTTYTTIHDETFCNDFYLQDDTGKIKVLGEKLEFVMMDADEQYSDGDRRHTQYVLLPEAKMLVVGGAIPGENNVPQIAQEPVKKVFAIVPSESVATYNSLRPLRTSALVFLVLFGLFIALMLLLDIRLEGNKLIVEWSKGKEVKNEFGPGLFD